MYGDMTLFGNSLAVLPTGFGKTVIALYCCAAVDRERVVVYVHKLSLQMQWKAIAAKIVPEMNVEVRTIQSQLHDLEGMRTFSENDVVIFDEVHHICAASFSKLIYKSRAGIHIALSATPNRKDGLEGILSLFFGRPSACITQLRTKPSVHVHRHKLSDESLQFKRRSVQGKEIVDFNDVLQKLSCSTDRNALLLRLIVENAHRHVLVLTRLRAHAHLLYTGTRAALPMNDVRLLLGNMKQDQIQEAKRESAEPFILVATTQSAGEGFDLSALDTLIFATPSSTVQQEVGRVLRSQDVCALVIDVVDNSPILNRQYRTRRAFYTSQGIEIHDIT